MLEWFVGKEVATSAINDKKLIEEDQIEVRPEKISDGVLDENVDIHLIRIFFTNDGWMLVKEVVEQKKLRTVYVCKNCYHDLSETQSVVCEHCLCWFHMKCVGLLKEPKAKYWYCRQCHASPAD